jgi:multidrug efflux pump subunit AcrB
MGAEFQSFLLPLLIMIALPPSFSGAFLALFICNQSVNINSIIALVVLFGTSVNNSIIIYEKCRDLKYQNTGEIIKVCRNKLRVIIMTTISTVFALIPFAIDPLNKSPQTSMSIAIIGGILLSTLIVLYIIPVIMSLFLGIKNDRKIV